VLPRRLEGETYRDSDGPTASAIGCLQAQTSAHGMRRTAIADSPNRVMRRPVWSESCDPRHWQWWDSHRVRRSGTRGSPPGTLSATASTESICRSCMSDRTVALGRTHDCVACDVHRRSHHVGLGWDSDETGKA